MTTPPLVRRAFGAWRDQVVIGTGGGGRTAGHNRGTVGVRWVGPDIVDVLPSTKVVKLADLA